MNVRDRDVESLVSKINQDLDAHLDLPAGYYITYGGAFENLQRAQDRLSIAVPLALGLIFLLLFFTFNSVKQSLLVFTAIPLAAIGGVFALWIRGIPFSISAGVGFIALFGIAVLNGIILISFFNQLKEEGVNDIDLRILQGTKQRLRPVLLTAITDALGFLPMALSTSAGAEVQRPLATVVIGGLITATMLTLVVLPVLYRIFDEGFSWKGTTVNPAVGLLLLGVTFFGISNDATAQQRNDLTIDQAIEHALENNQLLQSDSYRIDRQRALMKSTFDLGDTELFYSRGEAERGVDRGVESYGIKQQLPFPTQFLNERKAGKREVELQKARYNLTRSELIRNVRMAYYQVVWARERLSLLEELETTFEKLRQAAELRYETGETDRLERTAALSRYQKLRSERRQAQADLEIYYAELRRWTYLEGERPIAVADTSLDSIVQQQTSDYEIADRLSENPKLQYQKNARDVAKAQHDLQRSQWLPDLSLEYRKQQIRGTDGFHGFYVGVKIPLWFRGQQQRTQASAIEVRASEAELQDEQKELQSRFDQLQREFFKLQTQIDYYQSEQIALADELLQTGQKSYEAGDIDYVTYVDYLDEAAEYQAEVSRPSFAVHGAPYRMATNHRTIIF
ncbi:MAG: efflux RND transporter permease subunit [Balneolaceae bacterium]|nr:efflux RND transporter permease subunit [Balneolaceae bacterium]